TVDAPDVTADAASATSSAAGDAVEFDSKRRPELAGVDGAASGAASTVSGASAVTGAGAAVAAGSGAAAAGAGVSAATIGGAPTTSSTIATFAYGSFGFAL